MLVHITHDDPANRDWGQSFVDLLVTRAKACRFGVHSTIGIPADAHAILIISRGDEYARNLRRHPLVSRFRRKTFVHDVRDRPIAFLPGVYASLPWAQFDRRRHRAVGYLTTNNESVDELAAEPPREPDLLLSFAGSATAPVRKRMFRDKMFADRADIVVENTSGWSNWVANDETKARRRGYAELIARSRFVLCPRGVGTSSYRLFEAMQLGRVPVIVSDAWVPPDGPAWDTFSVRIAERDIANVPHLLTRHLDRAAEMGRAARTAWEDWFSPDAQFHRIAESLLALIDGGRAHGRFDWLAWRARAGFRRTRNVTRRLARAAALRVLRAAGRAPLTADHT